MTTATEQKIERELGALAFHAGATAYLVPYLFLLTEEGSDSLLALLGITTDDIAGFTEAAQDAVLDLFASDLGDINFTYDDTTPSITAAIKNDAVTDAILRDSAALSVIGRSANSTGDPADISAGTDGHVLRRSGTALGFGQLALGAFPDDLLTYAKLQNVSTTDRILGRDTSGAGDIEELTLSAVLDFIGSAAQGDILYRGAATWARLGAGTSGQFLKTNGAGANPEWAAGGGDVVGPASSTDNHIATFHSTTGKVIQDNHNVRIDDSSNVTGIAALTATNSVGTTTNDNAAAGSKGEYSESHVDVGSATSLTTNTAKTITSLSLTAGDWDVYATGAFVVAATTSVTDLITSISLTNDTLLTDHASNTGRFHTAANVINGTIQVSPQPNRISIASTTTVYLVVRAIFTVSTMTAFGSISARRVR